MSTTKRKNKHGRTGVKRGRPSPGMHHGKPVPTPTYGPQHPAYAAGHTQGYRAGYGAADAAWRAFVRPLLGKRNAKDIKGLLERKLEET